MNDSAMKELTDARTLAEKYGRRPQSGPVVAQAFREGWLPDIDITGLHIIGELLDRIEDLKSKS